MNLASKATLDRGGYALVMVLVFTAIGTLLVTAALTWASSNATMIARHTQYYNTLAAAEAATEKVLSDMCITFQKASDQEKSVYTKLGTYRNWVPTTAESSYWAGFAFTDIDSQENHTSVERISQPTFTNLVGQFTGLYGLAATYRVISNVRQLNTPFDIVVGLKQEAQVSTIPVFQFAIFYSMDLEINPGPTMRVTGRVHGNSDIYATVGSGATLRFQSDVTSVGNLYKNRLDTDATSAGTVTFDKAGSPKTKYNSLSLPIGTNNTPEAVYAILDVPPASETETDAMYSQRYYNKADLVVKVSNTNVIVTSGAFDNFLTSIPTNQWTTFLNTNASFYDQREGKTVKGTEIDVGKLVSWSAAGTNAFRVGATNRDVNAIFVVDKRTQSSSTMPAVRLINGQTLPDGGLTVATPHPLYVKGHYNAPSAHLGTTNTTLTQPASLVADAVNVLSSSWNDANSTKSLSYRTAASTTLNAAIISGIVPTVRTKTSSSYSGGVENFPRFLENWSSRTLTYNGSMVVMFTSQVATNKWPGTGTVYNPPTRNWAFDLNYMDPTKLPPGTPSLRALVRATWTTVAKGSVN